MIIKTDLSDCHSLLIGSHLFNLIEQVFLKGFRLMGMKSDCRIHEGILVRKRQGFLRGFQIDARV
ncbi:hypothetical protein SDC9_204796 [bioreactor metagenome]|uniref:Uncharacterized protein n=1 Tax=bioreactor metagenome TaxID=1076179 RepID=A0A645J1W4_9ZZZZ